MPVHVPCANVDGGVLRLVTDFEHFVGVHLAAARRFAGLGAPHLSICRESDIDLQLGADEVTAVMRHYLHRRTWPRGTSNKNGTVCLQYEADVLLSVVAVHARGCRWKERDMHICFVV